MEVFIKALLILVILAAIVGMVVLMFTSDSISEWIADLIIGVVAGIAVGFAFAPVVDFIIAAAGDKNTEKAGWLVITIIVIAVTVFVTIWLHENTNIKF